MLQTELNLYWVQTILYYCWQINQVYFDTWGVEVGSWGYDESSNLYIVSWNVDNETYNIPQPDINTLLSYDSQNVIDFHNSHYLWINDINNSQPYIKMTSTQIDSIPADRITKGYRVYDTTLQWVVQWDGSQWIDS